MLDSHKCLQFFDWKWVNGHDSVGGSSFLGQIPSFQPSKWHFVENFCFGARFILYLNLDSHKFVQLFNCKWVNEQDSVKDSTFSAQFYYFSFQNDNFSKTFDSVLILFCARIQIHTNLHSFSIGNGSMSLQYFLF